MDAPAENILPGLAYVGIVYEGPVPEYVRDLPEGGHDVLASKVYWRFPVGMVRCLSARDLVTARVSDLDQAETREDYEHVADSFGYTYLGVAVDAAALDDFKAATVTLQERRWESMEWRLPENGLQLCWWVTSNIHSTDEAGKLLANKASLCYAQSCTSDALRR